MSPGFSTDSYPTFAHIGLKEIPGKKPQPVCVRICVSIRRPEFECSGPQLEGPEFECSGPQLEGPEFEYSELSLKVVKEQRINVVSWRLNGLSFAEVQERFCRRYRTEAPTRTTIRGLVNKFQRNGNVCNEKRSGRPSTSQETVETIQKAIEQSPKASTRRLSREHGIPKSTVWQTLRLVLKKKAYYIQVLHHLEPEDYAARFN
ncbi:hypothetical protein ANN_08249 [Periplaneta americana]|uniref:DUF4817 domain-containing protein n=1 Tax=Periplaneta americana TaxID=6978 RepID=A0ABQ8T0V7_PERAM|nr:hypothetical protein ANN_08249 [Periplaneta americana]